jgi:TRAP transporter TAXI family solute receptor
MKMKSLFKALALTATAAFAGPVQADLLRGETNVPGSGAYLGMVGFANVVQKHTDHSIEVSAGVPVTRSMVSLAKGDIDISNLVYFQIDSMRAGKGPFAKLSDASELAENMRFIIGHPSGAYHIVTFAESGITSLDDIKGKRVYSGPKGVAMRANGEAIILGETGYVAGEDYEILDLDLKGGEQAFKDGHVDVWIRPAPMGGALIEQMGVSRDIRLLGMTDKAQADPEIQRLANLPGRGFEIIEPDVYTGQVNEEPVTTFGFWLGVGAHKDVSADVVYDMTKAVYENLEEYKATSKSLFGSLTRENAFQHMNAPLHLGAYRYLAEIGVAVPEALIPPEATGK